MAFRSDLSGKWMKASLAAFGVAGLSVPLAASLAQAPELQAFEQQQAAEDAAEETIPVDDEAVHGDAAVHGDEAVQGDEAVPADDAATVEEAGLTEEQIVEGRTLFANWSCNACHILGDANASGQIGPALDGNDRMDLAFVVSRVTDGQGAMPGFGGQMTEEEIALLSAYIMQVKK